LIILKDEDRANNVEFGPSRHKIFFDRGYIIYESRTDKTDEMIMALLAYLETLLNTDNDSNGTYFRTFQDYQYNDDPIAGRIDFIVEIWEVGVSAIS